MPQLRAPVIGNHGIRPKDSRFQTVDVLGEMCCPESLPGPYSVTGQCRTQVWAWLRLRRSQQTLAAQSSPLASGGSVDPHGTSVPLCLGCSLPLTRCPQEPSCTPHFGLPGEISQRWALDIPAGWW